MDGGQILYKTDKNTKHIFKLDNNETVSLRMQNVIYLFIFFEKKKQQRPLKRPMTFDHFWE